MPYDRDELLRRVDLEALFVELTGPGKGAGRGAMYRCPSANHAQTGKTPPVSVDREKGLWRCHGCGAGGTAIDLLAMARGLAIGEAIEDLARRVQLDPEAPEHDQRRPPRRAANPGGMTSSPAPAPARAATNESRDALGAYVSTCARLLWESEGSRVLAWLRERGLSDDVLRANRVGADPGPKGLERPAGLPRRGVAAVFPVLGPGGEAIYCQARYLQGSRRWDNPAEDSYGANPRLAVLAEPEGANPNAVVVCEGMTDALTAAGAGLRAVAVLGAAYPDQGVVRALLARYPTDHFVVAFDADERGEQGARLLGELLQEAGARKRTWRLAIPGGDDKSERDLNGWARAAGEGFGDELERAWAEVEPLGWEPAPSAAELLGDFYTQQADVAGAVQIPTGIVALDRLLAHGGWRPGVVLLGGMAGIGKSAFALHSALHAAAAGHPVLYLSVEQSPMELLGRIFCRETRRPISDYWNREPEYLAAAQAVAHRLHLDRLYLRSDPFVVEDHLGTVGRLRQWAVAVAEEAGRPPLIIVDYLQRMRPPEAERRLDLHRQISMAGLGLRQLARDLSSPVLAISSVNRQSYDKPASLDAFKGSGDLEYDADVCILLRFAASSDEEAKAMAEASGVVPVTLSLVGKNRYGPTNAEDPIRLDFDRSYGSFRELHVAPARTAAGGSHPNPPANPPTLHGI